MSSLFYALLHPTFPTSAFPILIIFIRSAFLFLLFFSDFDMIIRTHSLHKVNSPTLMLNPNV